MVEVFRLSLTSTLVSGDRSTLKSPAKGERGKDKTHTKLVKRREETKKRKSVKCGRTSRYNVTF